MTFWQYLKKSLAQELAHKLVWGFILAVTLGPLIYFGGGHGIGWYRSLKEKTQAARESVGHKIDAAKDAARKGTEKVMDASSTAAASAKETAAPALEKAKDLADKASDSAKSAVQSAKSRLDSFREKWKKGSSSKEVPDKAQE